MLSAILGIFGSLSGIGKTISSISADIAKARIAVLEAGTEEKKIEAARELGALETRRDVLVEEAKAGNRLNSVMRAALAFPWAVLFWKVLIWDTVLHELTLASTPALSTDIWWVGTVVIGFYFLASIAARR